MPLQDALREDAVLVLTGPTASGKSEISIRLAQLLHGEIISADSMQIYRTLDIGTAKVPLEAQGGIPHHLYDIRNPHERYSVANFLEDSRRLICDICDRGKLPIVCGGTGQYISALLDGLQFLPEETNLAYRAAIREEVRRLGLEAAHAKLQELDPKAAQRIDPQDEKRIVRFFEVYKKFGMNSSEVYAYSRQKGPDFYFVPFVLWPERSYLYERINQRSAQLFERGVVEELENLLQTEPDFSQTQAFQAIGYKEILPYLEGQITREEAIAQLAMYTRRYAKRQLSLFRKRQDLIRIEDISVEVAVPQISKIFCEVRFDIMRQNS